MWPFDTIFFESIDTFLHIIKDAFIPALSPVNIEAEADKRRAEVEERLSGTADESFDIADVIGKIEEAAIDYYMSIGEMQQGMVNLFAVGLRHMYEQQLYQFYLKQIVCLDEEHEIIRTDKETPMGENLTRSYKEKRFDLSTYVGWDMLEELRRLSNCIKHGEGPSCQELKKVNSVLFDFRHASEDIWNKPGIDSESRYTPVMNPMSGTDIYVTVEDLTKYAEAVRAFWQDFFSKYQS